MMKNGTALPTRPQQLELGGLPVPSAICVPAGGKRIQQAKSLKPDARETSRFLNKTPLVTTARFGLKPELARLSDREPWVISHSFGDARGCEVQFAICVDDDHCVIGRPNRTANTKAEKDKSAYTTDEPQE